jgi:hypothetical protein
MCLTVDSSTKYDFTINIDKKFEGISPTKTRNKSEILSLRVLNQPAMTLVGFLAAEL